VEICCVRIIVWLWIFVDFFVDLAVVSVFGCGLDFLVDFFVDFFVDFCGNFAKKFPTNPLPLSHQPPSPRKGGWWETFLRNFHKNPTETTAKSTKIKKSNFC